MKYFLCHKLEIKMAEFLEFLKPECYDALPLVFALRYYVKNMAPKVMGPNDYESGVVLPPDLYALLRL